MSVNPPYTKRIIDRFVYYARKTGQSWKRDPFVRTGYVNVNGHDVTRLLPHKEGSYIRVHYYQIPTMSVALKREISIDVYAPDLVTFIIKLKRFNVLTDTLKTLPDFKNDIANQS